MAKKRAPKKKTPTRASASRSSSVSATGTAAEAVPVWRWVHLIWGLLHFVAAAILYALAEPTGFDDFAGKFCGLLVVLGVAISAYGAQRLTAKDPKPSRLDQLHFGRFFLDTWKDMDEEARLERESRKVKGLGWDWRPFAVLIIGAVSLTLMEYFGGRQTYRLLLETMGGDPASPNFWDELRVSEYADLFNFVWWSGWRVFGYFLIPLVLVLATRQKLRDQGLETKGFFEHAWIYAFAFEIVFICVVIVSYTDEFSNYYPFYKDRTGTGGPGAGRSWVDFISWELLYAAQFFSLEFFFRGWWLKNLKPMMGSHAIFAMVVPYCMIHYGKPFPETMGAIAAGIVLGTLAMKTRSIWSGFMIHVSVAIAMDVAALLQGPSGLPTQWYPS